MHAIAIERALRLHDKDIELSNAAMGRLMCTVQCTRLVSNDNEGIHCASSEQMDSFEVFLMHRLESGSPMTGIASAIPDAATIQQVVGVLSQGAPAPIPRMQWGVSAHKELSLHMHQLMPFSTNAW